MKKPHLLLLLGVITTSLQALPMDPIGKGAHAKLNDPAVNGTQIETDPSHPDPVYVNESRLTAAHRRADEEGVSDQSTSAAERRAPENIPLSEAPTPLNPEPPEASPENAEEPQAPTSQQEDRRTIVANDAITTAKARFKEAKHANGEAELAMTRLTGTDLSQEEAACTAAKGAWEATVIAYQEAITKAKQATFDAQIIEELENSLQEAEVNVALWNAHGLNVGARKEEQDPAHQASPMMEHLITAWNKAVEAYHEAMTKAQAANLSQEARELRHCHEHATTKKTSYMQQREAEELRKREAFEAQVRGAEELTAVTEKFFAEVKKSDTSEAWSHAAAQAHSTSEGWNQLLGQLSTQQQFVAGQERTRPKLESTARFQQKRWEQKALLAEIRAEIRKTEPKNCTRNDLLRFLNLAREKTQPALEQAFERVLSGDQSEAAIAALRSAAYASASTCASTFVYDPTSTYVHNLTSPGSYASVNASSPVSSLNTVVTRTFGVAAGSVCAIFAYNGLSSLYMLRHRRDSHIRAFNFLPIVSALSIASGFAFRFATAPAPSHVYASALAYASSTDLAYAIGSMYTSASPCEAAQALRSVTQLRDSLQAKLAEERSYYDTHNVEKNLLEGAMALTNKTARFAAMMNKTKTKKDLAMRPSYRDLETSGLLAFQNAYYRRAEDPEAAWKEAQAAATQVVTRWSQEIEKKKSGTSTLSSSFEEMEDQRERWQQNAFLAELHALEESAAFKQKSAKDRLLAINTLISTKSWPLMKTSMERLIAPPYETLGTRTANPIEIEDQAEQLELQACDWKRVIEQRGSNAQRAYALDVTSTTARFLRGVAASKREELTNTNR